MFKLKFICGYLVKWITVCLILDFVCIALAIRIASIEGQSVVDNNHHDNKLALEGHHLFRFKRQQSSGENVASNTAINSNQQQGSSTVSASSSDKVSNPQDESNREDKEPSEALTSFKCDFGSADSPDFCKFKILESANPLNKGLASWSHGSGKLALFQGGPLIDASAGNDTTGGYIFYETSNPYILSSSNQSALSTSAQQETNFGQHDHLGTNTNRNHHENDYSAITSSHSPYARSSNVQHLDGLSASSFQHVSSARVTVGGGNTPNTGLPAFVSPNLTATGPSGMCLSFSYAIQGLSAEELRIHVNDQKTERSRFIWSSSESAASNWTKGEVLYSSTNVHSIMFSAAPGSSSISRDFMQRKFRGYIALDEIEINKHDPAGSEGACKGHCNFDGDLCGWTNAENSQEDDFDWSFGRGSDNLFTGPPRDYTSSNNNEPTGSYLHIDPGYPRRPGDRAILMSPMFQPTAVNDAMCMRLAVHMFGSGTGSLIIKIRYSDDVGPVVQPVAGANLGGDSNPTAGSASSSSAAGSSQSSSSRSADGKPNNDLIIWEMSGDSGNNWHQAQTSVSSSKSPFQVLIEGVIGENHLGNIAIDEISFSSGPCPTSPPIASKNYGDCTFEQSMCYWRNPDADMHLDDLDWVRSADEQSIHGPNFDHTLKKRSGSYLKLENTFREPKSGTRAFLLSPIFQPKSQGNVQCLSFYYYMFMRSISSSGPNLGTIRVYLASNNELVPIWRLTNPISSPVWKHARSSLSTALIDGQPTAPTKLFQIAFEGIWGDTAGGGIAIDDITVFDGACDIMPPEAKSVPGECTFDVDLCSWSNKTSSDISSLVDSTDSNRSPFIQSVNSASGHTSMRLMTSVLAKKVGWQLATVDSRPVNLQDHTYKAPIGYIYVDVLDSNSQRMTFPLQSSEVTVQSGVQVTQCLSFWFAAYGRQDSNQLNVYLTQASAPPTPPEDSGSISSPATSSRPNNSANSPSNANQPGPAGQTSASNSLSASSPVTSAISSSDSEAENSMAWKSIDGKLLWSMSLKNITESNRRKWLYGQVSLKADSNYIVRFIATSNDGGFGLDDISYYDGACETRPHLAKVSTDDEAEPAAPVAPKP